MQEEFDRSYTSMQGSSIDIDEGIDKDKDKDYQSANIFDNLPVLVPPKIVDLYSELDCYLSSDVEHVLDPIAWWRERRGAYPCLSHMALNYLTIPGASNVIITIS